ncbi:MAG: serine hydrolase, partial [Armatimonadota bacterium]
IKAAMFSEPVPGYLKSLTWTSSPPIWGSGYEEHMDLDALLAAEVKKQGIPGVQIGVLRNNEIVYLRGFGYSDLGKEAPFMPNQATRVGSISKVVTGVIIFRLIQDGKLSLDTNINKFFKEKVDYDIGQDLTGADKAKFAKWTVRNLLEMSNGFNGNYGASYSYLASLVGGTLPLTKNQCLRGMIALDTNLKNPGEEMVYNNTAFMTLGRMAETVSGKPLDELIKQEINNTSPTPSSTLHFSPNQSSPNDPARGQEPHYYQFSPATSERWDGQPGIVSEGYGGLDLNSLGGAGSIAFSAEGLAKFIQAVQLGPNRGRRRGIASAKQAVFTLAPMMNAATWAEYTKPPSFTPAGATSFYRAGQMYKTAGGRFCIEHGATLGHATGTLSYVAFGKSDYQVIVLANSQKPAGIDLGAFVNAAFNNLSTKLK